MNICIVGFGNFGKKYIKLINKYYPNYNIYILRHSLTNETYDDFNIKKIFYSYEELNTINIDVVIIANPCTFHVKTANYFIEKNISCLIEKPLSNTLNNAKELLTNDCVIQVGYLLRYSKLYNIMKNYNKYINKILSIKINVGQYLPSWRNINYKKSVSSSKKLGGGVLLELSHDINYILGIINFDKYNIKSILGKLSNLDLDVEDTAFILIDVNNILISINIDMIDKHTNRSCKLIGDNSSLYFDFIESKVMLLNEKENKVIYENNKYENLLLNQFKDFIDKVSNKDYSNKTVKDAILTNKIIDQIKLNATC